MLLYLIPCLDSSAPRGKRLWSCCRRRLAFGSLLIVFHAGACMRCRHMSLLLETTAGAHIFRTLPCHHQLEAILFEMVPPLMMSDAPQRSGVNR